jgi:diguanylate cyclase (GGDEF)-like protein
MTVGGATALLGVHRFATSSANAGTDAVARSRSVSDLTRLGFDYEHAAYAMLATPDQANRTAFLTVGDRLRAQIGIVGRSFGADPVGGAAVEQASSSWATFTAMVQQVTGMPGATSSYPLDLAAHADDAHVATDQLMAASFNVSTGGLHRAHELEWQLFGVLGAAFLVSVAVATVLARKVSRHVLVPVEHLREGAARLAAGDLAHRVDVPREDELGELARSFNVMAEALAAHHDVLRFQATHDPLTGLGNRAQFNDMLETAFAAAPDVAASVLFIDLDDFKVVNDSEGHGAGDTLLQLTAERLHGCCRGTDFVARLGGDEFAVVMTHPVGTPHAATMAERILQALASPFTVNGKSHDVAASIGIATDVPSHVKGGPAELVRRADVAMYMAKARGKGCFEAYDGLVSA